MSRAPGGFLLLRGRSAGGGVITAAWFVPPAAARLLIYSPTADGAASGTGLGGRTAACPGFLANSPAPGVGPSHGCGCRRRSPRLWRHGVSDSPAAGRLP